MKYVPYLFVVLALFTAAAYGYPAVLWWLGAVMAFVPVQSLVAITCGREEVWPGEMASRVFVLWGALAAWPIWDFSAVVVVGLLVLQLPSWRWLPVVHAAMVLSLPWVVDLHPWRSPDEAADVPMWVTVAFAATCALIAYVLVEHVFVSKPKSPKAKESA
jgi:hypothetical protein